MKLFLYNTLTREKEEFVPYDSNEVKMYTCGPTVYWYQHIGNMFAYVCADVIKKTLQFAGYKVNHVMGVTDVGHLVSDDDDGEDKMEKGARRENISVWDLAEKYTDQFFKDTKSLNITKPATICKATDYIQEQIDAVKTLEDKGFTYQTSDGIYFDSSKDVTYGELAKLDIEGLCAGERVEMAEKKSKTDFALWKFSPKNEKRQMEWDSPWGVGFPGWHIECSSFCLTNLGENIDIHTGGIDHIPVHHTNEIAQNKGITGHRVVKYWLHSNWVVKANGGKISKSEGDKMLVEDFINDGFDPLAYRYLILMAHYRKKVKFSTELLKMADTSLKRLNNKILEIKKETSKIYASEKAKRLLNEIKKTLFDDFNTAKALTIFRDILSNSILYKTDKFNKKNIANGYIDLKYIPNKNSESVYIDDNHKDTNEFTIKGSRIILNTIVKNSQKNITIKYSFHSNLTASEKLFIVQECDKVFSLNLGEIKEVSIPEDIVKLAENRQTAKQNKNWELADTLRNEISSKGFSIEDTSNGYEIKEK